MRALRVAQHVGQCIGTIGAAVDDHPFGDTGIEQGRRDPARATTSAEQQCATPAQVETLTLGQVTPQARAIGVVTMPTPVDSGKRVDRSRACRALVARGTPGTHPLLLW